MGKDFHRLTIKNVFRFDSDFNYAPHNEYKGKSQTKKFMFNNSDIYLKSELPTEKGFLLHTIYPMKIFGYYSL